ncbi:nectin-2 isoform X4 [Triplophysa rosa]|uniref:nectin-2 isoform X4 n=1 Tax=Triplophysa rosa TaxID=992332 RepID=UPI002545F2F5|nr:nectin-2 isoform X4 [Triplophysa rosa]
MNMTRMLGALFLLIVQGSLAMRVRVEPEVVSYPGQTVTLRCQFPNPGETQLTQVSWILEPYNGERTNIAVFHPNFGVNYPPQSPVSGRVNFIQNPPTLDNPSIEINDVKMTDEGRYICEYATYPSGNEQGVSSLVMLAKPRNTASTVTVTAGNTPVVVARCESFNGRPAATISWSTTLNGNATVLPQTNNPDNTVTVQSEYMLAPQPADNGKDITCVVSHRTMAQPERFPMKLVVEYPPRVQIVGYDNNWYKGRTSAFLTCQADGNPLPTTVTWRTLSGLMPETVQVQDNRLAVQNVDDSINTTFICEVRNRLGSNKDQVTVFVRGGGPLPEDLSETDALVQDIYIGKDPPTLSGIPGDPQSSSGSSQPNWENVPGMKSPIRSHLATILATSRYSSEDRGSETGLAELQRDVLLLQKRKAELEISKLEMEKENLKLQNIILQHKINTLAHEGIILPKSEE